MKEYTVIYEWAGNNYSAYVPDLPGCVATGKTLDEVRSNVRDAIGFHLKGLREDSLPIPEPKTVVTEVETSAEAA